MGPMRHLREPFNGLSHLVAAILSFVGTIVLLVLARGEAIMATALAIYGLSLTAMFSASAAYHLAQAGPVWQVRLRKMDHIAIYLLIAGTYTPIGMFFFSGAWRWGILITIWSMAVAGIVVKTFVINAPRWLTAGIYLVMGWLAVAGIGEILRTFPVGALAWLIAGGLFYSVGAVVYIVKRPNFKPGIFGFHELWHVFVVLAAFSHFMLILLYVAIPSGQ